MPILWVAFCAIAALEMLTYYLARRNERFSAALRKRAGEQPVAVFDPDDKLDWQMLRREYVDRGVPFVLRRASGAPLSRVAPHPKDVSDAFETGCIRVAAEPYLTSFAELDELVHHLFPWTPRAYWPFWFLGKYSQGKAHLDLGPHTLNCYFLRQGSKDVVIVPPEVSRRTPLVTGLDGLFIDGSESEGREYLAQLPYWHRVDLQAQSMLVFNNTASIHQFRNVQAADGTWPEALSIRVKYVATAEPRIWQHLACCKSMVRRFSGVLIDQLLHAPAEERPATYL